MHIILVTQLLERLSRQTLDERPSCCYLMAHIPVDENGSAVTRRQLLLHICKADRYTFISQAYA
jgi:hypothetical protein